MEFYMLLDPIIGAKTLIGSYGPLLPLTGPNQGLVKNATKGGTWCIA